jgi:chlorobactene glucosyltransferase
MTVEVLRRLATEPLAGILAFQGVVLCIVLSNAVALLRPRRDHRRSLPPLVSVLVPARNEARNVRTCVRSLLAQRYPRLELLVLDDRSEDETRALLDAEQRHDPRLVILAGAEPPPGWKGKNWACHQLSLAARGDVLLFVDADTEFFDPDAVGAIVGAMEASRADLVSGLPQQALGTLGETLLVPLFYWSFFSFTPLAAGLVWRRPAFTRAVGQLMAFRAQAYHAIGGHAAIRESVVDDLALARRVARAGLACRILDATGIVRCRMYRSGREAYAGFRKNLFAAFGYAILPYLFVWAWLAYAHVAPLALLVLHPLLPAGVRPEPALLAASIGLALIHWLIAYGRLKLPIWPALLYPLTTGAFLAVAIGSLSDALRRRGSWKGRALERPPTRWI